MQTIDQASSDVLTLESIHQVRDFTARKTLEQAHALLTGLGPILGNSGETGADELLFGALVDAGITAVEADEIQREAVMLMELMADRDRKADIFHDAVKAAGQRERALYERLAALARQLRAKLGSRSPALARLSIPPAGPESEVRSRIKALGKPLSAAVSMAK